MVGSCFGQAGWLELNSNLLKKGPNPQNRKIVWLISSLLKESYSKHQLETQQLHAQPRWTDVGRNGRLLFSGASAQKSIWLGAGHHRSFVRGPPSSDPESLKVECLGRARLHCTLLWRSLLDWWDLTQKRSSKLQLPEQPLHNLLARINLIFQVQKVPSLLFWDCAGR